MAITSILAVVFIVQGGWTSPLGFGVTIGGGGAGGGGVSLGLGGGGGKSGSALKGLAGNMAGLVNMAAQFERAKFGAAKSGVGALAKVAGGGLDVLSNAMDIPVNAANKFVSGMQQSVSENLGDSNSISFGSGGSGEGKGYSSGKISISSTSTDSDDSFSVPDTDMLRTMDYLRKSGVDLSKLVTDIGYNGADQGKELMKEILSLVSSSDSGSSGSGFSLDLNSPGVISAIRNLIGSGVDLTNQGIQVGANGINIASGLVKGTSSTLKDFAEGLIGNGEDSGSKGTSSMTTVTYKNGGRSNGGKSGSEYSYDVNIPSTGGIRDAVGKMVGAGMDMADQGVQMGANGVKAVSSTINENMKDLIGVGDDSGSKGSSYSTTVSYKNGGHSNGGKSGSEYSYDVNIPSTGGIRDALGKMVGAGMDMADQGVQMGANGVKTVSSTINENMKDLIGVGDVSGSKGSSYSTTVSYKNGGHSNGGKSGSEYSYDVNIPSTGGIRNALGKMVGAGMDMADQGVQMGTNGVKTVSSTINENMKDLIGVGDDSGSKGSSYSTTVSYKNGGHSDGGKSGSEYSYDVNIPSTGGILDAMGKMVGAGVDMADQGVQMGTNGVKAVSSMTSGISSTIKENMKDLIGVDDSGSKGSSSTTTLTYKNGGHSNGGHLSVDYSNDRTSLGSGVRKALGQMAGSGLDLADQTVQMGTNAINKGADLGSQASSAMAQGIKGMVGANSGSSGSFSLGGGGSFGMGLPSVSVGF